MSLNFISLKNKNTDSQNSPSAFPALTKNSFKVQAATNGKNPKSQREIWTQHTKNDSNENIMLAAIRMVGFLSET